MKPLSLFGPLLFGSALLAGAIATSAPAAETVSGANIRSGPGANYQVVGKLKQGDNVTVSECVPTGWCRISGGWVSAKLLADNGNAADYYNRPGGRTAIAEGPAAGNDDGDYPILIGRADEVGMQFGFGFGRGFFGFGDRFMMGRPMDRGDLVCLVTFFSRDDVAAGRDADVQRAQVLSRRVAERRDGPNDRRAIFEYGSDRETIRTCRYLDRLN